MKKKVKTPKAEPKAKPSRKLPLVSPVGLSPETKSHEVENGKEWIGVGLSPETETLIATLSDQQRQMMRTVLEVVARTKLTPKDSLGNADVSTASTAIDFFLGLITFLGDGKTCVSNSNFGERF